MLIASRCEQGPAYMMLLSCCMQHDRDLLQPLEGCLRTLQVHSKVPWPPLWRSSHTGFLTCLARWISGSMHGETSGQPRTCCTRAGHDGPASYAQHCGTLHSAPKYCTIPRDASQWHRRGRLAASALALSPVFAISSVHGRTYRQRAMIVAAASQWHGTMVSAISTRPQVHRWKEYYHGAPASGMGKGCLQVRRHSLFLPSSSASMYVHTEATIPWEPSQWHMRGMLAAPASAQDPPARAHLHRQLPVQPAPPPAPPAASALRCPAQWARAELWDQRNETGLWGAELMLVGPMRGMLEAIALSHVIPKLCWDKSCIADIGR